MDGSVYWINIEISNQYRVGCLCWRICQSCTYIWIEYY